jgi:hypothetical protein
MRPLVPVFIVACGALLGLAPAAASANPPQVVVDVGSFRVVDSQSGPDDYYTVVRDAPLPFIHAQYRPGLATTVLGWQAPDQARSTARILRWKWRVEAFPRGGDECAKGREDSAAVVYVTWKHLLRWTTLKYVWSSVGTRGTTCGRRRNPFVQQDTVILESGGATDTWVSEEIDLRAEYRRHFADGAADADVPDFAGVGIMSDGDQTHSDSSADYAGFSLDD